MTLLAEADALCILRQWHDSSTNLTILSAPASPIQLNTHAGSICSLTSSELVVLEDRKRTSIPLLGARFFEVASRAFLTEADLPHLVPFVGFQTATGARIRIMEQNTCQAWSR